MKLLLHIGTEKTGTTSLQKWLTRNGDALKRDGLWYCESLGQPNNRRIATYGVGYGGQDESFRRLKLNTPAAFEAFAAEVESSLAVEVTRARAAGCRLFVISNEHMHSRLIAPDMVARVRALLGAHFDDIAVQGFLRPQVDLAISRLSIGARTGHLKPDALAITADDPYFDYNALWQRWTAAFADVTLLPFKRHKDVVAAICEICGLDQAAYPAVARVNEKLDVRAAQLAFAVQLPRFVGPEPNRNAQMFLDDLPVDQPISISATHAQDIAAEFAPSNAALIEACATLQADDLKSDQEFAPMGNFETIFDAAPGAEYARHVIIRLNVQLWLERCRTQIATAGRELAVGDTTQARAALMRARLFTRHAAQANLPGMSGTLSHLRARIDRAEAELQDREQTSPAQTPGSA